MSVMHSRKATDDVFTDGGAVVVRWWWNYCSRGSWGWSHCRTSCGSWWQSHHRTGCGRWWRSGLGHVWPGNFVRAAAAVGERDSASGGESILLAALVPAA